MTEQVGNRTLQARCIGNLRTCNKCQYRYTKEDKKWKEGGTCPQCGAERRCSQSAAVGINKTVCLKHGAGHWRKGHIGGRPPKDGIFRHLLPKRMLDTYDKAYNDARLTELRNDIALLEARRADLISRADMGESGKLWKDTQETWRLYKRAKTGDIDNAQMLLFDYEGRLDDLIGKGFMDTVTWKEIEDVTDQLRKLRVDENRRQKELKLFIDVNSLMALMGKVVSVYSEAVKVIIKDPKTERELSNVFAVGIKGLLTQGNTIEGEFKEIET